MIQFALVAVLCSAPVAAQDPAPAAVQDGAAAGAVEARVVSVDGDVAVYTPDAPDEAVPLTVGAPLEAGDRIRTGGNGKAELTLEGQGLIDVGPDSDFTVSSLDRQEPSFTLSAGRLLAKIKAMFAPEGRLSVHTPTAVAAIRGTEFGVDFDDQANASHVGVFDEGKVAVTAPEGGQETLLTPHQETLVPRGKPPVAPRPLEHFAPARARFAAIRRNLTRVSATWRPMPPARRAAVRREALERFRSLPPEKREQIRHRVERRRAERREEERREDRAEPEGERHEDRERPEERQEPHEWRGRGPGGRR